MFDPQKAEMRFGCGVSPVVAAPTSVDDMVWGLERPDPCETRFPIESFPTFLERLHLRRKLGYRRIEMTGTDEEVVMRKRLKEIATEARQAQVGWLRQHMLRRTWTAKGFRERLAYFWGDHFTAVGKTGVGMRGMSPYIETTIRPNIAGRFGDMLIAVVTQPLMLLYLDQSLSIGPNSEEALTDPKSSKGMNENLAREILELHTLGVEGPYKQSDVVGLAKLLAGLGVSFARGFIFKTKQTEPGEKTILGVPFGGGTKGQLADVSAALHMLAIHPATARHIATKLAVHFVGDAPSPDLIEAMTARYLETGGYLSEVYRTLLGHPDAWTHETTNVKHPFDYMSSALRALAIDPDVAGAFSINDIQVNLMHPLGLMGQPWEEPQGPDGWPEEDAAWLTPQGLAARMQWAMAIPTMFQPDLPDPNDFAQTALGGQVPGAVTTAMQRARNAWEGVGLVLSSPSFQAV